jgi:hypothetical protein
MVEADIRIDRLGPHSAEGGWPMGAIRLDSITPSRMAGSCTAIEGEAAMSEAAMNQAVDVLITSAYLVLLAIIAVTLRGMKREIKRIADRMEEPE